MKSEILEDGIAQRNVIPAHAGWGLNSLCDSDVFAMLDYLHEDSRSLGCDHSFKFTKAFLTSCYLPIQPTLAWLQAQSVRCDCDVLNKFELHWRNRRFLEQIVDRLPRNGKRGGRC